MHPGGNRLIRQGPFKHQSPARKVGRAAQTPDAPHQLFRLQQHKGAEQFETVESDHNAADAINPRESAHVDLAAQPVEHEGQAGC